MSKQSRNNKPGRGVVKPATGARYKWPPPVPEDEAYVVKNKNPIHSILTALPIIMLVAGLYYFFQAESDQSHGIPIRAESRDLSGVFTGLSVVKAVSAGRHYLWMEADGKSRGVRIQPEQVNALQSLERGGQIEIKMAPSVEGSTTYWVWHVEQDGRVVLDAEETLR